MHRFLNIILENVGYIRDQTPPPLALEPHSHGMAQIPTVLPVLSRLLDFRRGREDGQHHKRGFFF